MQVAPCNTLQHTATTQSQLATKKSSKKSQLASKGGGNACKLEAMLASWAAEQKFSKVSSLLHVLLKVNKGLTSEKF